MLTISPDALSGNPAPTVRFGGSAVRRIRISTSNGLTQHLILDRWRFQGSHFLSHTSTRTHKHAHKTEKSRQVSLPATANDSCCAPILQTPLSIMPTGSGRERKRKKDRENGRGKWAGELMAAGWNVCVKQKLPIYNVTKEVIPLRRFRHVMWLMHSFLYFITLK